MSTVLAKRGRFPAKFAARSRMTIARVTFEHITAIP